MFANRAKSKEFDAKVSENSDFRCAKNGAATPRSQRVQETTEGSQDLVKKQQKKRQKKRRARRGLIDSKAEGIGRIFKGLKEVRRWGVVVSTTCLALVGIRPAKKPAGKPAKKAAGELDTRAGEGGIEGGCLRNSAVGSLTDPRVPSADLLSAADKCPRECRSC